MTAIGQSLPRRRRSATRSAPKGQTGINNALFWTLALIVLLAPLPLGSNRALAWSLWATIIGSAGIIYVFALWQRGEALRVQLGPLLLPAILMGVTGLWLLVQLLPLGAILPGLTSIPLDGGSLPGNQISIAPDMTAFMLTRQLTYGVMFFLVLQVCVNDSRRTLLLNVLLAGVLAYGLYGEISLQTGDTILGIPKWAYKGVATGPFVNRNSFATFLAFGSIIAAGMVGGLMVRQSQRHPDDGRVQGNASRIALYGLAYLFLMAIVIATQSRMGLVSALAGTLAVIVMTALVLRRWRRLFYVLPAMLLVGLVGAFLFGGGLFERLESIGRTEDVRAALYAQILQLISLRPWTGFGGGSFELAYPLVHDLPVDLDLVWDKAHNSYLGLWSDLGLVFGTLPVLALGIVAFWLVRGIVRSQGSFTAQVIALGVIVVGAVHSLADFSLEIQANTFLFLTLIASGLATITARTARAST